MAAGGPSVRVISSTLFCSSNVIDITVYRDDNITRSGQVQIKFLTFQNNQIGLGSNTE